MKQDLVINMEADADKRRLWGILKTLKGKQRFEISRFRPRRSDRANAFYWAVIVPSIQKAILETQGEKFEPEEAHEFAKAMFLSRPVVDKRTGELLATIVGSSAVLSTEQFANYIAHIRQWVGEYAGIDVPDPDSLGIRQERPARRLKARAA